jgi:hypothetical protein
MRREDYQPGKARNEACLSLFDVSCVKCNSVNLKFISEFDDQSGETAVYLFCPRCPVLPALSCSARVAGCASDCVFDS